MDLERPRADLSASTADPAAMPLGSWNAYRAQVPSTPQERLERAHPKLHNHPSDRHTVLPLQPGGRHITSPDAGESTVLYLAYGSNLCAQTFRGKRGIRPVSRVNVTAPSLTLTFDLPGLPYLEPCFANTAPRLPGKPPFDPPTEFLPGGAPVPAPALPPALIGVVYEVTASDYAKIIATEGGGSSYTQIVVPCLAIPPSATLPGKPVIPEPPKPFLARTLYRPRIPDGLDDDDKLAPGNGDDENGKTKWKWLLPIQRPDPYYAQASLRYLTLIRTGAVENDLPQSYQDYLKTLQPYKMTCFRQKAGRMLMIMSWGMVYIICFRLGKMFSDDAGRMPTWLAVFLTVVSHAAWTSYDVVFKPLFGDGERTEDTGDENCRSMTSTSGRKRRKSAVVKRLRRLSRSNNLVDEEINMLDAAGPKLVESD